MAEKLNPCPFCGGKPSTAVTVISAKTIDVIKIRVGCYTCEVWRCGEMESGGNIEKLNETMQKAVSGWNKRAEQENDNG